MSGCGFAAGGAGGAHRWGVAIGTAGSSGGFDRRGRWWKPPAGVEPQPRQRPRPKSPDRVEPRPHRRRRGAAATPTTAAPGWATPQQPRNPCPGRRGCRRCSPAPPTAGSDPG
ncbi:hypothetical protein ADJ73_11780 [Arsenicicoccus sp. oral taxon 190]|nr:hypothetical protein ADJ73_11780 [Arsenicicoccus sp. oral taxon 190]